MVQPVKSQPLSAKISRSHFEPSLYWPAPEILPAPAGLIVTLTEKRDCRKDAVMVRSDVILFSCRDGESVIFLLFSMKPSNL